MEIPHTPEASRAAAAESVAEKLCSPDSTYSEILHPVFCSKPRAWPTSSILHSTCNASSLLLQLYSLESFAGILEVL
jgi:hypothetical protein